MLLGQELKFKNKLCNLKLGTFFSAFPGLGASALSGRVEQNLRNLKYLIFPLRGKRSRREISSENKEEKVWW